ncbi:MULTISPECIES: hypothetical protein [Rubrivivax]|uniref:Flagellar protein FlgN n=1 Tax=Rubrivivax benzoatilyticus TaxID=316997 RepID=A0ABX0I229_9BURK|nr:MULTISPECIES: hypothetical protein [Rubrivivax]MCD0418468.1 hypothetical protein [Rubrivivax sp. JA1024]MCC9596218.1 hypothetical protein [Rubrivivax sp. JA1055]MCC9647441.1 hypothetical protein [Rubrivivax sp. JA1029]NHK99881.1 hypothetical protein [Rubrivivax benzoatilyticus]NHL25840.1 hypothetical protein [Rubrivivax benzoatilyticus]
MLTTAAEMRALQRATELEAPLDTLEQRLAELGAALAASDAAGIESAAGELHGALAAAVEHFARAAREGGVPMPLRQRLAVAGGQVAAQREALARATAALDRAIDVLLPNIGSGGYGAAGASTRTSHGGSLLA